MTNYNPEGNAKVAKIVYIAEAPSTQEMIEGRPLAGPSGRIFNSLLHQVGHADVYIDDRGLGFDGTFPNLDEIKEFKPWNKM